jgi:hypothetical protein
MSKFAAIIVAVLSTCSTAVAAEEKMVVDMNNLTCGELTKTGFPGLRGGDNVAERLLQFEHPQYDH